MAGSPKDIDALDAEGLKGLLLQVLEENAALCAEVAALREENRRLKGLKGPPTLKPSKPSGMEKATAAKRRKPGRRGPKTPRGAGGEVVLQAAVPPGSASRATRTSWSRISCCARTWSASAASAG